jgi:hypothetical protein
MSYIFEGVRYIKMQAIYRCRTCGDIVNHTTKDGKSVCNCGAVRAQRGLHGGMGGDPRDTEDLSVWKSEGPNRPLRRLPQHVVQQRWDAMFGLGEQQAICASSLRSQQR